MTICMNIQNKLNPQESVFWSLLLHYYYPCDVFFTQSREKLGMLEMQEDSSDHGILDQKRIFAFV
jgi:hypothetical protein